MNKLLALPLLLLATASSARSQDQTLLLTQASPNVDPGFARTSVANSVTSGAVLSSENWTLSSLAPPPTTLAALSFSPPTPASDTTSSGSSGSFMPLGVSSSSAPLADPSPASPVPSRNYEDRAYSWEVGLGFALVRFRSSQYYATAPGVYSELAYYFWDWIAIEGNVVSAFAPTIYGHDHVKFLGYTAGPKFTFARHHYEPWVHVLVGGMHILPQTAVGGQNGFEFQAGAGVDYPFNPRFSARIQFDYLGTHAFGQYQNSGQGAIAFVFHF